MAVKSKNAKEHDLQVRLKVEGNIIFAISGTRCLLRSNGRILSVGWINLLPTGKGCAVDKCKQRRKLDN